VAKPDARHVLCREAGSRGIATASLLKRLLLLVALFMRSFGLFVRGL
jgi:hypothetical protein